MVSPRVKFIVITVDELILVPIALVLVYFYIPELLPFATVSLIIGAIIFVAAKYYLVYPSLQEGSHALYDLQGMTGKVIDTVTEKSGKIKVGAEIWEARCDKGEISIGVEVNILSRESMRVRVEPKGIGND